MTNKFQKVVSCVSAAAMMAAMAFSVQAAETLGISNGADLAGYAINGTKVKMSVTAPSGTAKIKWYMGLDSKTKTLIREVDGSQDTFWVDLQREKKYIFAEALDADGNIIASGDRSMQYGSDLTKTEEIISVNFDEAEGYGWYGHQNIIDKNTNYVRSSTSGKIGVSYGNPITVADPLSVNGTCMKLNGGDFNYIEAANNTINYGYTLDKNSIYVFESDMMFEDLSDRNLTKVTYQDAAQAAAGNTAGRDSVAITLSNGSFEFYGNTIPAETNKWYNVKYVYDAINGQLTALVDNQYLGLAAGVDMTTWGRLSYVESKTTMYLDNLKLTRYAPSATIAKDGLKLTATHGSQIWRSLDGIVYKKVSDNSEFTAEALPYPQYFVSRVYDGDKYTQSQTVVVDATYQQAEKTTYFDYDFSSSNPADYNFTYSDSSKISVADGKLVIAPTASAMYELTDTMGDLKGLDSGVIYVEADISLNDWRNNNIFRLRYLRDLAAWGNYDEVYVECAANDYGTSGTLFIRYIDADGNNQKIDTGISYTTPVHYQAAVDVNNNVITLTMNGQEFKLNNLRNIRFLYSVTFGSYGNTTATVDNAKCYKYNMKNIDIKFGFAEKSYLYASDSGNNIESGMSIASVITNDGDTKSFVSYAAAYDENGNLAEVRKGNTTISGDYVIRNFRFVGEYPENKIKIFSWNDKLQPVLPLE